MTPRAPSRALPCVQRPPVPSLLTHPAVPVSWVKTPVVALREKTTTALPSRAPTYTFVPSGLTVMLRGPTSALAFAQLALLPVSAIQPVEPLNWVNTPVTVFREKTATVLPAEATYT